MLAEQSAHGYELLERLKVFGFSRDPGGLYRVLRSMEREGMVDSQWEASGVGPSRCLYRLTPLGREWLAAWADTLDETRRTLEDYQRRYLAIDAAGTESPRVPTTTPPSARLTLDDAAAFKTIVRSTRP
jgi:DNA-binding PadR family transcriptional regulator